jgi:hypothetical protein
MILALGKITDLPDQRYVSIATEITHTGSSKIQLSSSCRNSRLAHPQQIAKLTSMPDVNWDGKLYRSVKFGEGVKSGTVELEHEKRRRKEPQQRVRESIAQRERNGTI